MCAALKHSGQAVLALWITADASLSCFTLVRPILHDRFVRGDKGNES